MAIKPNTKARELDVGAVDGGRFRLGERKPQYFTMVVFYRGYHCATCKAYLRTLQRRLDDFAPRGAREWSLYISRATKNDELLLVLARPVPGPSGRNAPGGLEPEHAD